MANATRSLPGLALFRCGIRKTSSTACHRAFGTSHGPRGEHKRHRGHAGPGYPRFGRGPLVHVATAIGWLVECKSIVSSQEVLQLALPPARPRVVAAA